MMNLRKDMVRLEIKRLGITLLNKKSTKIEYHPRSFTTRATSLYYPMVLDQFMRKYQPIIVENSNGQMD